MYADEVWASVSIYGPQVEIERFKQLCIVHDDSSQDGQFETIDFTRVIAVAIGTEHINGVTYYTRSVDYDVWNFRLSERPAETGAYRFAFDTSCRFPVRMFERLAELFPALAFDCECIGSDDEAMGFGWFNPPEGGEDFDYYDVPEDYWTARGAKRDPELQMQHNARIEKLLQAVRSGGSDQEA